jgi:hypothetical protein
VSAPRVDPQTMKRLAFIRLLYQQGVDQSQLPEPLIFTSVLAFHDAAELFLILAGEHLGASLPDHIQFMKYWAELHPNKLAGGADLSGKVGMDRLNRMRNGFKHAGTMPGRAAIEQARADVANFLEDNTPRVFGIQFSGIDMADVVPHLSTRGKIKSAVAANEAGDRVEGMALLVEAFEELFGSQVELHRHGWSPFSFGENLMLWMQQSDIEAFLKRSDAPSRDSGVGPERGIARQISWLTDTVNAIQSGLRVMALGIDYARYQRFRILTPYVSRGRNNQNRRHNPRDYAPSQEEFDYCHDFVIMTALRMSEIQSHTVPPSWKAS